MPDRSGRFNSINGNSSDFFKVLLALKANTMRDIHVATLGQVISYDSTSKVATVKPFPLVQKEAEKLITCYTTKDVATNDIVVVLFTDRDFIQNLKQLKAGQQTSSINDISDLHSERYGIIIGTIL